MADRFAGKTVVVTGGTGNLGTAVVKHFADAGATVISLDRNQQKIDALIADLNLGERLMGVVTDVTKPESVDAAVSKIEAEHGDIHVLVHTVGGFAMPGPVHEGHLDMFDKQMTLNARALYITCGRIAKHMVDREIPGHIIVVLSRAAEEGGENAAVYSASKAAAQRIMESMNAELKGYGIHVNGVSPSIIDTPPNRDAMPDADFEKWVTVDEIAGAMKFLASDDGSGFYGDVLKIYGRS